MSDYIHAGDVLPSMLQTGRLFRAFIEVAAKLWPDELAHAASSIPNHTRFVAACNRLRQRWIGWLAGRQGP